MLEIKPARLCSLILFDNIECYFVVQITSPFAYMFIAVHHNVTSELDIARGEAPDVVRYTYGWKDICAVFFYFLICIVMHAIIQEYVLDVSN